MRTLIVGIGALGGLIAARLRAAGSPVWLATRNAESAARLKASGLRVTGGGGAVSVETVEVAPLDGFPSLRAKGTEPPAANMLVADYLRVAAKKAGVVAPPRTFGFHGSEGRSLRSWSN